jgi:hypothetical protein
MGIPKILHTILASILQIQYAFNVFLDAILSVTLFQVIIGISVEFFRVLHEYENKHKMGLNFFVSIFFAFFAHGHPLILFYIL